MVVVLTIFGVLLGQVSGRILGRNEIQSLLMSFCF